MDGKFLLSTMQTVRYGVRVNTTQAVGTIGGLHSHLNYYVNDQPICEHEIRI